MAHFFVEYDSLVGLLSHATSVTSDSALKDSDKTVVFMIHEDGDSIIAAKNSDLMVRVAFNPEKVEKAGNIQINSSELAKILGTYTSLSRTKVDSVEFRENETRVQVIVHESDLDEEQNLFGGVTSYSLDNIKIKDRLLDDLKLKFEEETAESVNVTELDMVLSTLIPVMDSKKGVNNNFIHFADDVIFVMDTRCQVFYKNILPEVLHNVSLRYTSVSYMKKMSETSNHLLMVLQGNKFAVRSEDGSIEAFINYIPVRFNYKPTYEGITKANGVILDRKFLKDILRRLSTMGADATFTIKEDGVHIRTNDFSRVMPINNAKGDIMGIEFKMKTSLLSYMIVGDDSIMSSDLFLYLEKATRGVGYQLSVSDDSGAFISNARIS